MTGKNTVTPEIARHLIRANFRCSRELQEAMHLLKAQLPEEDYRPLARGIAAAVAAVGEALTAPALRAHPELEAEIEQRLARYGSYI